MEKLKKETIDTTIKYIKNLFKLEKGNKAIKEKILRDIRKVFKLEKENKATINIILRDITNLFDHEKEENYYKLVRVSNFWSNKYIEHESIGDRTKTLSPEEYLNKIWPYLKDPTNNLNNLKRGKLSLQ